MPIQRLLLSRTLIQKVVSLATKYTASTQIIHTFSPFWSFSFLCLARWCVCTLMINSYNANGHAKFRVAPIFQTSDFLPSSCLGRVRHIRLWDCLCFPRQCGVLCLDIPSSSYRHYLYLLLGTSSLYWTPPANYNASSAQSTPWSPACKECFLVL